MDTWAPSTIDDWYMHHCHYTTLLQMLQYVLAPEIVQEEVAWLQVLTSMKNHFYKMKKDIGMADYEKLVKQDFHTPSIEFHTPSLYLCFFL